MLTGPNVRKLILRKISVAAIPDGGGLRAGIEFLQNKERVTRTVREATEWAKKTIDGIRKAKEPNPWKDASDEAIAGEILRKVAAKEALDRKKARKK